MKSNVTRLFFIDAMRAWAILMMLQGHFIDGLLDPVFRNPDNLFYSLWLYFRGITAPVFFTVSGFIFTYLLIKVPKSGLQNPRVKKGIRRGLQLLLIGYLLRLNLFGILTGKIYDSFYLVDVLHCIGLSILCIIGIYSLTTKRKPWAMPSILLGITLLLFLFEPIYKSWSFSFFPDIIANYLTKVNGSVFTIIPWLGYTTMGAFLSILFTKFNSHKQRYANAILIAITVGLSLIFLSSDFFLMLYDFTGIELFQMIPLNNYLFIRLGDVFLVFAVFMIFRKFMTNKTVLAIGASTLSIYVIHFILLYGSFTGLGLYRFLNYELTPLAAIIGALLFMFSCTFLALRYHAKEHLIKSQLALKIEMIKAQITLLNKKAISVFRDFLPKVRLFLLRIVNAVR